MGDRAVAVSLVGGGQAMVSDPSQIEGLEAFVVVRDDAGQLRVTEWTDPEALRAVLEAKLRRSVEPPASLPDASTGAQVAGSVFEALDNPSLGEG